MHQGIPIIEKWGNPNNIKNIMKRTKENNQKVGKTGQFISKKPTQEPEHDKN
jgi:hypothetical protein